jgi:hypothetical protein
LIPATCAKRAPLKPLRWNSLTTASRWAAVLLTRPLASVFNTRDPLALCSVVSSVIALYYDLLCHRPSKPDGAMRDAYGTIQNFELKFSLPQCREKVAFLILSVLHGNEWV